MATCTSDSAPAHAMQYCMRATPATAAQHACGRSMCVFQAGSRGRALPQTCTHVPVRHTPHDGSRTDSASAPWEPAPAERVCGRREIVHLSQLTAASVLCGRLTTICIAGQDGLSAFQDVQWDSFHLCAHWPALGHCASQRPMRHSTLAATDPAWFLRRRLLMHRRPGRECGSACTGRHPPGAHRPARGRGAGRGAPPGGHARGRRFSRQRRRRRRGRRRLCADVLRRARAIPQPLRIQARMHRGAPDKRVACVAHLLRTSVSALRALLMVFWVR